MEIRKSGAYYSPSPFYSPRAVQPQAKGSIKFSGTDQRVKNPKIFQLESKIADLEAKIKKNPDMLPEKRAEIEAEIEKAEFEIVSLPQTVELSELGIQSVLAEGCLSEQGMPQNTTGIIDYWA